MGNLLRVPWTTTQEGLCLNIIHGNRDSKYSKANLKDLIAATGLIILLKLDSNHQFSALVTLKFDGKPRKTIGHLFHTTSSFVHHFIYIGESKLKLETLNWVTIADFVSRVRLEFDRRPWKTIGHLFYAALSFVHYLIAIIEFKLELQSGNAQFGSKPAIFCPLWTWNLTDDREKQ